MLLRCFNLFCRNSEISSVQSAVFRVVGWKVIRRQTVVDGVYKRLKVVLDETVTDTERTLPVSAITPPTTYFPEYHIYKYAVFRNRMQTVAVFTSITRKQFVLLLPSVTFHQHYVDKYFYFNLNAQSNCYALDLFSLRNYIKQ